MMMTMTTVFLQRVAQSVGCCIVVVLFFRAGGSEGGDQVPYWHNASVRVTSAETSAAATRPAIPQTLR